MSIQAYTTSGYGEGKFQPLPIIIGRDPISTPSTNPTPDIRNPNGAPFQIGQFWFNNVSNVYWFYAGLGLWLKATGTGIGDVVDFIVPNGTSPVVPDALGNISLTSTGGTVAITGGLNSINLEVTSAEGFSWVVVTTPTRQMEPQTGYIANSASLITFTLPPVIAVGQSVAVVGLGSGGWSIVENAGQQIIVGRILSTPTTGSVSSTNQYDNLTLLCVVANTTFVAYPPPEGNLTIV
jgi:hypothetical protein